jgi:hypothetical protein
MSMSSKELAEGLVALCREGKFDEAVAQFYSEGIVSVEAVEMGGMPRETTGIDAVKAKGEWWTANHEVHSIEVTNPAMSGDEFIVRFVMDVTSKQSGQRMTFDELAAYWVKDGKIVREQFFYAG